MRRRQTRRLATLMGAILLLVAAEGALIAWVFVSPSAEGKLEGAVNGLGRWWNGEGERPGLADRIDGAWDGAYEDWIAPLWGIDGAPPPDAGFEGCVSCHGDYAAKRRFSAVYMDHPAHAQIGVGCAECHRDTTHPDPLPVEEARCEGCHQEVQEAGGCVLCHPPASLPHFYLAGAPRDRPVVCESCHEDRDETPHVDQPSLVHDEVFDGTDRARCLRCHERQVCASCHAERHPDDWVTRHGPETGWVSGTCESCHDVSWCADACHASIDFRPGPVRPLPTGGVP